MEGFDDPGIFFSDNFGSEDQPDEGQVNRQQVKNRLREFIRQFHEGNFTYKYRWGWQHCLTGRALNYCVLLCLIYILTFVSQDSVKSCNEEAMRCEIIGRYAGAGVLEGEQSLCWKGLGFNSSQCPFVGALLYASFSPTLPLWVKWTLTVLRAWVNNNVKPYLMCLISEINWNATTTLGIIFWTWTWKM